MASMPELGSKISLISKADIRYEGQLFTVDPAECTIALANVRSYGTEDRETQYPILPQNQVYDYILFRGSDIKDIRVVNNVPPVPNDPAIMQLHLPSQMGQQGFQSQFPVPVMGHLGAQLGQFGGQYNALSGLSGLTQGGTIPGFGAGQQQPQQPQQQQQQQQQSQQTNQSKKPSSRSTTPVSLTSRKSPTVDMGVQVNQKEGNKRNQRRNSQNRERRDSSRGDNQQQTNRNQQRNNNQYQQGNANQNRGGWVRNNNNNNNNNQRGNQRPRGRGPPQAFRQNVNNQNQKGRPKTTIKFESDYDFEQANSKFEELRHSLAKLKVGEDAKPEQVNGETDKKDDSGNETGAGEHEQEEEEVTVGYDKTKSFFDNISCEAAQDRTKGKTRTDWRHERKINSETFGVSSARRGGFYNYNRGRGGNYFNRNQNNGGGYRNGGGGGGNNYNRGGNFRNQNRNFNQRNQNQQQGAGNQDAGSTGLPQQTTNTTKAAAAAAAAPPATQQQPAQAAVAVGGN